MPNFFSLNSSDVGKVVMGYFFPTLGFLYVVTAFPFMPIIGQPSTQVTGCKEGKRPKGPLSTNNIVHHSPVCVWINAPW
jgi:hypothetical protein